MTEARIAAALTDNGSAAIRQLEGQIDFWEVRMDLIGAGWPALVEKLRKPWIACNRRPQEGGQGQLDEAIRIAELLKGLDYGAAVVDIELSSARLGEIVPQIRKRAKCLVSYHNYKETPEYPVLAAILERESQAGADICKIVTTAQTSRDNIILLKLIKNHPELKMVAFAMGTEGRYSRILAPLAGAYFTFASVQAGKESAAGQLPAGEMREIYDLIAPGLINQ